ncbi:MAG: hypothetical protein A3I44_04775 [Candidatus Sungbacteria bacterium RIFCSPLOWO2_02_FULL_51_17]|uniref:Uncharacterized protein n=1 Tax=Candidatus Sungbacteria bacterium RIFCSPHIGHO2_02_FULL_51_29 TaxID=1802273 RepID=A0A1G2KPA7_9BACT|nr:MAG: hypothetical protein A2676_01595 [Candidatus Sungbacteria bacterium RIFCSPHIGHO2_01_FULL_51_22]OHA01238.1 MAG: hypothetical protein A3C16_02815 [Candidatus Sungbacteria bacterium RIFCSPHIGHO2_02_FULL_51_29]OHA05865.1 MAG: hypothetical protein A3B29_01855 [Candidatus Sungbacteria bacterium RIFCSPLOWO2_01_FULL_51_34]OHA11347.1 MAG: hypothetical protein A3I44_04775 [Candidatus Sungbacteria bacterium RIFCSPLOWO2_02_FULL_51_17]
MVWWQSIAELVSQDKEQVKAPETFKERLRHVLIVHALDWLYGVLFIFTHFYFVAIAFLFFSARGGYYFLTTQLMEALSEPYLGALGVYVLLKELRKRKIQATSRHYGEIFVAAWQVLLIVAVGCIVLLSRYHFDDISRLIITDALAVLFIYAAGKIHRP